MLIDWLILEIFLSNMLPRAVDFVVQIQNFAQCLSRATLICCTTRRIRFRSPELKGQVSFPDRLLSVVLLSVSFSSSSPEPVVQFSTKLGKRQPLVKDFKIVQMKEPTLFQRENNAIRPIHHNWKEILSKGETKAKKKKKIISSPEPYGQF